MKEERDGHKHPWTKKEKEENSNAKNGTDFLIDSLVVRLTSAPTYGTNVETPCARRPSRERALLWAHQKSRNVGMDAANLGPGSVLLRLFHVIKSAELFSELSSFPFGEKREKERERERQKATSKRS